MDGVKEGVPSETVVKRGVRREDRMVEDEDGGKEADRDLKEVDGVKVGEGEEQS